MLVEGFYTIESINKTDDGIVANIALNPDHNLYQGHFPDQPVVPGVMQLQIVKELLELHLGKSLSVSRIKQLKYLLPVVPIDNKKLTFNIKLKDSEEVNAVFSIDISDRTVTKGSLTFQIV